MLIRHLTSSWSVALGVCYFWSCSPLVAAETVVDPASEASEEVGSYNGNPAESELLPPMSIIAPRFKPSMTPMEKYRLNMVLRFGGLNWVFNNETVLTPERIPQRARNSVYAVHVLEKDGMEFSPHRTVMPALRSALGRGRSRANDRSGFQVAVRRREVLTAPATGRPHEWC
jgi:hypothetical protein